MNTGVVRASQPDIDWPLFWKTVRETDSSPESWLKAYKLAKISKKKLPINYKPGNKCV